MNIIKTQEKGKIPPERKEKNSVTFYWFNWLNVFLLADVSSRNVFLFKVNETVGHWWRSKAAVQILDLNTARCLLTCPWAKTQNPFQLRGCSSDPWPLTSVLWQRRHAKKLGTGSYSVRTHMWCLSYKHTAVISLGLSLSHKELNEAKLRVPAPNITQWWTEWSCETMPPSQINHQKHERVGCALFKIHQALMIKVHVKINQNIMKTLILRGFAATVHQWHSTIYGWSWLLSADHLEHTAANITVLSHSILSTVDWMLKQKVTEDRISLTSWNKKKNNNRIMLKNRRS